MVNACVDRIPLLGLIISIKQPAWGVLSLTLVVIVHRPVRRTPPSPDVALPKIDLRISVSPYAREAAKAVRTSPPRAPTRPSHLFPSSSTATSGGGFLPSS
jgi:hypothetical protein